MNIFYFIPISHFSSMLRYRFYKFDNFPSPFANNSMSCDPYSYISITFILRSNKESFK